MKDLLESGAPVNFSQDNGVTAIHSAAYEGDLKAIEILLARSDIDLTLFDHSGNPVEAIAVLNGNPDLYEKIVARRKSLVGTARFWSLPIPSLRFFTGA